ncbi:MAG: type II secretion system protein [Candidatus Saccharibacteria bacterium]|nr:type II secretion system protein [Candidatus Saccharibacteria bacterium]
MLGFDKKSRNRGDTLIEVLFAVSVFSLVAVGSLSIMNQGTATAERALEITLVRQQIDAQAEALRYLNASYILGSDTTEWPQIHTMAVANAKASDFTDAPCTVPPANTTFVLNTHTAKFVGDKQVLATTYSQVRYSGDNITSVDGIWIQPVAAKSSADPNQKNNGYIDFHIRACWDSPGQPLPVKIGTIVRLYEPR